MSVLLINYRVERYNSSEEFLSREGLIVHTPDGYGTIAKQYPRKGFNRVGVRLITTGEIYYYFLSELK